MVQPAFVFNRDASYQPGGIFSSDPPELAIGVIQTSSAGQFNAGFADVFACYRLPKVSSDSLVQKWHSDQLHFWQNQVNFAVWCATTGCGVSAQDHLLPTGEDPMLHAVFRFHAYYQVRRILAELEAPIPQDAAWNAFDNPYNRRAYERICLEFGVPLHTDWRQKGSENQGLGAVYNYWTNTGYRPVGAPYDRKKMSFTEKTTNRILHVDYIAQGSEADEAWSSFILDTSEGFTQAGVERINDSIRTYVWAILGAQAQTRTSILGDGTSFDAQRQFLSNVEDAISSPVDLPSAISRYQDVLCYACSKVDFVFGTGLYMAPSDMELGVGTIQEYNNEIVIAGPDQRLGINSGINAATVPPQKGILQAIRPDLEDQPQEKGTHGHPPPLVDTLSSPWTEERSALVMGGVLVGLVSLLLFELSKR